MTDRADIATGRSEVVRQGGAPRSTVRLDDLDRAIIRLLRRDGRLSYADVARAVGVSEPTVRKRMQRLLRTGAVSVAARVNPAPIGFPIDAVMGIRVERGRVREVGRKLAAMDNVAYVGYLTGSFDIMIEAFLPDTDGLFRFLNEDLERIDGILATETWHVLRTEKCHHMWEGENVGRGRPDEDGEAEAGRPASPEARVGPAVRRSADEPGGAGARGR